MNLFVRTCLLVSLFLSACGTLEISVDRTPTPNVAVTATLGALQAQNAQLANQIATLNPASAPLTMSSSSETIREKMQTSTTFWKTIFLDGVITWYPPNGGNAPAQVFHEQGWIDYASHRYRVLLGPMDGNAETFKTCDGSTILEIDLKTGQSQARPLPKFAQENPSVPGQDMLWSQIGTPLTEIALSANYAAAAGASGGTYTPVKLEPIAGRQTLVVDWIQSANIQPSYRAWLDVETGVILKFQEFGKGGGDVVQGERVLRQIIYDANLPDALFGSPASTPQFSDINGNPLTPTAVVPTLSSRVDDPLGYVYFFISDHNYGHETIKLVRLPGSCATGQGACPEVEEIPTPFPLRFSLTPLVWSPDGKMAAYAYPTNEDGNKASLFLFNPKTLNWKSLTEFNFLDPPMWSPDGTWLTFREQDGQGNEDTYAIRWDGTGLTNLTASGSLPTDGRPYAADGWLADSVIFQSKGAAGKVYLVNPKDGTAKQLFQTLAIIDKGQLFPSQDGKRLSFVEYAGNDSKRIIKSIDAEGTNIHDLAAFPGGALGSILWSPDGTKVVFMHFVDSPPAAYQDVYVVNYDGTGLSQVYHGVSIGTLALSPDGTSLLVQDHDASGQHIFVINLTTLKQHMIQAPNLPLGWWWQAPSWQP